MIIQQTVDFWNLLPKKLIKAEGVKRFKKGLDKVMNRP